MEKVPTPEMVTKLASDAGITITEMLHRARLSPATFSRWKNSKRRIRTDTLQRMLDAIDGKEYVKPPTGSGANG